MTTLVVGAGNKYATIHDAVAAAQDGDVVRVKAGTYVDDFTTIRKSITLEAIGGTAHVVANSSPPNGKAIFTVGASGADITISGFELSGAAVRDQNGAGIRHEGGNLTLTNDYVHDNQAGLLAATDPNATITVRNSEFSRNGAGDGYSHNLYVGAVAQLTIDGSYFHDAVTGHEIKSRAESTTVTNSRIFDNGSDAAYSIDLPNGGNATIRGNVIQQGANSGNPAIVAYAEEGAARAGTSLVISGNTVVNDLTSHSPSLLWNASGAVATISGNAVFGLTAGQMVYGGSANVTGTTFLSSEPSLDRSSPSGAAPGNGPGPSSGGGGGSSGSGGSSSAPSAPAAPAGPDTLVVTVSEDAWRGDAQFVVTVDGQQVGGTMTATASHLAGQSQAFTLTGNWGGGAHRVGVSFTNDAWGGPGTTGQDRNLYVDAVSYNGRAAAQGGASLWSNGTAAFDVAGAAPGGGGPGATAPVTSTLVLGVSGDAWQGEAQFVVTVDGQQRGGVYTATASHAAGQSQAVTISGIAEGFSPHDIAVSFLNDAWGGPGTTGQDRNLYVDSVQLNGRAVAGGTADLYWNATQHFTANASADWTGA